MAAALEGATDTELDSRPGPDKWTAREIVHHLADSEMTSAIRLRLLVAEENAAIRAYDEKVSERLHYDRPIAPRCSPFRPRAASTGDLLDKMTDADFAKTGTHPEHGAYSVDRWLEIYAEHAHKHADQIRRARAGAC